MANPSIEMAFSRRGWGLPFSEEKICPWAGQATLASIRLPVCALYRFRVPGSPFFPVRGIVK